MHKTRLQVLHLDVTRLDRTQVFGFMLTHEGLGVAESTAGKGFML